MKNATLDAGLAGAQNPPAGSDNPLTRIHVGDPGLVFDHGMTVVEAVATVIATAA